MIRAVSYSAVFAVAAVAGHLATLHALPPLFMSRAMEMLQSQGAPINAIRLAPRMTPQTQTVVRPSPDLAYSICLFDVTDGPVRVEAARGPDYASMSVYDARTDNIAAFSLRDGSNEPNAIVIALQGEETRGARDGFRVNVDHPKGVVLIRRLAPTAALYDDAARLAEQDLCEAL